MNLAAAAQSSIGRKLINGLTGLLLIGFVIGHLTGNFLLLAGPKAFNDYAYFLEHLFHGYGIYVAEAGLLVFFLSHAWSGYSVWNKKWQARKSQYAVASDAGGKSKKSIASSSMLWTGCLLIAFVVIHIAQFKFGVFDGNVNRTVNVDGVVMRDLYGIVIDAFASPLWTGAYLIVMAALGVHLWHGAWSAFQSLGLANEHYLPTITKGAHALAGLLAAGFLFLPAFIMITNENCQKIDDAYMQKYQASENIDAKSLSNSPKPTVEKGA